MKLAKQQLKQIIREEIKRALKEIAPSDPATFSRSRVSKEKSDAAKWKRFHQRQDAKKRAWAKAPDGPSRASCRNMAATVKGELCWNEEESKSDCLVQCLNLYPIYYGQAPYPDNSTDAATKRKVFKARREWWLKNIAHPCCRDCGASAGTEATPDGTPTWPMRACKGA